MPANDIGMNVSQSINASSIMSSHQHSQKQKNSSKKGNDNIGIFQRLTISSAFCQLFELDRINILTGNLDSAIMFLMNAIDVSNSGVLHIIESPEVGGIFHSILNLDTIYAGDVLSGAENNENTEASDLSTNDEAGSESNGENEQNTERERDPFDYFVENFKAHETHETELGSLSPSSTPLKKFSSPSHDMEDSIFN